MGKPHPMELRLRVVAFVKEGHSHRDASFPGIAAFRQQHDHPGAIVRLADTAQTRPSARRQVDAARRVDRRAPETERRSHAR